MALHVQWDCPDGINSTNEIKNLSGQYRVQPGSINPNLFQDQCYKYGSFGNPDKSIRDIALQHTKDSIEIARRLQSRDISMWFADGSNYPGTANIRQRKQWFEENLKACHADLSPGQRLLVEYKPFEPAFYHTDIADWGMALLLSRTAGPQAKVLVDTGHHYLSQNIEQIVTWLLSEDMLGGFHFNDRRYADDDLTLGSIDPYQVFRIFHEILYFEWETGKRPDIAYMIDQSHNLKGKIEAMIQTVVMAQMLFAKAAIVDHPSSGGGSKRLRSGARRIPLAGCVRDRCATGDPGLGVTRMACRQIRWSRSGRADTWNGSPKNGPPVIHKTCRPMPSAEPESLTWRSILALKAGVRCSRVFTPEC